MIPRGDMTVDPNHVNDLRVAKNDKKPTPLALWLFWVIGRAFPELPPGAGQTGGMVMADERVELLDLGIMKPKRGVGGDSR